MAGMKKSYLFMALDAGVVAMRAFACWCPACMHAIRRGEGSLDSNLCCIGCMSPHFKWEERSVARTDAAGVANSRKKAQTHARKLAAQLQRSLATSARVLVAVQNRGEEDLDQYWLGWATRVQQPHESEGTVPGTRTRYDAGDFEIEIDPWLQRDVLCCAICYAMLRYAMLCYAMLCYAMLCYAMLCYAMLCYAMLCYAMVSYAMLCYAMLCCAVLCYAMLWYAMLCYVMLCYAG